MSAGNPTPLLTLVREDLLTASESDSLRYATGAAQPATYDEIKLQTPRGEGAAIPRMTAQNRDVEHELIDGKLTWTKRVISGQIDLAVDYIDNGTRRRLERWMLDRARVLFSPGYGTETELYWRPRALAASAYDLTGKWMVTANHDAASAWVWDAENGGLMRLFGAVVAKTVKTDFGAGQVFSSELANILYASSPPSSYPVGSSNTDSGWEVWGTWAADITRAFVANGFGCTDCPGSLRAYSTTRRTGDGTNGRVLGRTLPAASLSSAGTLWCGVFLKGRPGSGSKLWLQTDSGFSKEVSLAGMDLSRWTFVHVGGYYAGFTGSVATTLKIVLTPETGVADDCDIQVGPSVATFRAGAYAGGDAHPQWCLSTRTSSDALKAAGFVLPRTGAMFWAMYVPRDVVYDSNFPSVVALFSTGGSNGPSLFLSAGPSGHPNMAAMFWYGSGANDYYGGSGSGVSVPYIPAATFFTPGSVQTFAVTWGSASSALYWNGALLATRPGSISPPVSATDAYLWSLGGSFSAAPTIPLAVRVENSVLSAGDIADLHATYSNKASAGLIAAARGRVYQIEEIPSIPRTCDTGTNWVGNLRLRQVEYVPSLADITTKEG